MTLPLGFKAAAERRAVALRADLGLEPHDPLDMRRVAAHLPLKVVGAETSAAARNMGPARRNSSGP
ncbi:hypothetical protein KOI35_26655 [Actinoplanes bogorensis]|uniref:Uncharacterized protein n=1 Tax=Paractinoplanes bogorensis TaxID=1610840 RepID=A0ABS5YUG1_9ACTN|nr:hypothetical protein [Actinoplanes bogorensis]MBU2667093.1 hypothetical protein [Actinoplanes bogorensis]